MNVSLPELFALAGALCTAGYEILTRVCIQRGCSPSGLGFINSVAGTVLLLVLFPFPSFSGLTVQLTWLLILSSALWTAMIYFDNRAYISLDASTNAILGSLRFVLLTLSGFFIFHEEVNLAGWVGVLLILGSIYYGIHLPQIRNNSSLWFRLFSVLSGALAIIVDKYLTARLDIQLVLVAGYFIPSLLFGLCRPVLFLNFYKEWKKSRGMLLPCALLYALLGYFFVYGFGSGDLWSTIAIYRLRIVFVLVLAYFFLKESEELARRLVSGCLCVIGALLVALS